MGNDWNMVAVSIEDWRTKVGFEINEKKLEGGMKNVWLRFRMEKFLTIEVGVVIIDSMFDIGTSFSLSSTLWVFLVIRDLLHLCLLLIVEISLFNCSDNPGVDHILLYFIFLMKY